MDVFICARHYLWSQLVFKFLSVYSPFIFLKYNKINVLHIDTRYRKMNSKERFQYRNRLKSHLLGIFVIYSAFIAWWFIMGYFLS